MQQNEFFTVNGPLKANIEPLALGSTLPDLDQYIAEIPAPFMASSEFSLLDQQNDAAKHELNQHNLKHVAELIEQQNSKLNLLLNYIISQQDDPAQRHVTHSFGAGQLTYITSEALKVGQVAKVKLFLDHPPAGIYCYAEVIDIQNSESGQLVTLSFVRILEEHQDLLIKAALYQQQKLLRQRSLDRDNQ
ncbi:PilZ domain-containing protein [Vibrio mediterranei]|uniref:PilZ domain-containing protein n=1 Tax=Vibrio mediterranei TaxID=689 RepID=A0AAN1FDG8_9VIBR|nr:PilZ domain-containing protein [Vibrio mediterranei]ASI88490.1 PilZ domain-containing protein [Vibrio mediterranei]